MGIELEGVFSQFCGVAMVLSRHLLIMSRHLLTLARLRSQVEVVLPSQRQRIMNHFNLPVFLLTLLITSQAKAQLAIDNSQTASALVQNVLLGGGVAVSNITFNGSTGNAVYEQLSAFNSSNANVGINNGVFMATGGTQVAFGPNNYDNAEAPIAFSNTDPDLQTLANGEMINDAAVLEFDFIPSGSQVSFNFVFASEEYLEFVDQFNDVFGFFLSGPGINGSFSNGAVNIALIPGTSTPVSINTLNNFDYPQYYVDNGDGYSFPFDSDPYYIQFDGLTTSITASATVQCGQQYHIKLAVGDALDTYYDSGVFLQANAFSSPTMDVSVTPDLNLPCSGSVDISILNVTGGILPYSYEWSYGGNVISTDQTITVDQGQNGTYTATVTDGCGGTMQEQVIVGAPVSPAITLSLTPDLNLPCNGTADIAVLNLAGGTPPFTQTWSYNGSVVANGANYTVPNNAPGTYTMSVTDGCGGSMQGDVVVGSPVSPAITLNLTPDLNLPCNGTADIAVLNLAGGTPPFTQTWSYNGTVVSNGASYSVPNNAPGTYTVTVSDDCGGSMQGNVVVGAPLSPPINMTLTSDVELTCVGSVELNVISISGGTPPLSYSWSLNGAVVGTAQNIQVTAAQAGTYTLTVSDDCGGSQQGTVTVSVPPPAALDITVTDDLYLLCQGELELSVLSVSGGIEPYTYNWVMNGSTVSTTSTALVSNGDQGTYQVTVNDACNAVGIAAIVVSPPDVDPIVVVVPSDFTVNCYGGNAFLYATSITGGDGQYFYAWSDASGTVIGNGASHNVPVTEEATYTLTVIDNCSGSASGSITVHAPEQLGVDLPHTVWACEGGSATLLAEPTGGSGTGTYSYLWSPSNETTEAMIVYPLGDTTFTVQVTDGCGDVVSDNVTVRVEIPVVTIYATNIEGDEFELHAVCDPDNATYAWDFSSGGSAFGNPVVNTFADQDEYWATVTATTTTGCSDVDSVFITPASQIFFPNAFTPNGDGINDGWGPVGYKVQSLTYTIFDRWGAPVFTANSPDEKWDGSLGNGDLAPTGVYVYKFIASGERIRVREGIGSVTLLGQDIANK